MSIDRHVAGCLSLATPISVNEIQKLLQIPSNSVTKSIKRLQNANMAVRTGTSRYPYFYLKTNAEQGARTVPLTTTQHAILYTPSSVWALGVMAP